MEWKEEGATGATEKAFHYFWIMSSVFVSISILCAFLLIAHLLFNDLHFFLFHSCYFIIFLQYLQCAV